MTEGENQFPKKPEALSDEEWGLLQQSRELAHEGAIEPGSDPLARNQELANAQQRKNNAVTILRILQDIPVGSTAHAQLQQLSLEELEAQIAVIRKAAGSE